MTFKYDVLDLCPDGYNLLSDFNALCEELGYDEEGFYDAFEMTPADVEVFRNKFKYWPDLIPSGWGVNDSYVIPDDLVEWNENGLLLDLNDFVCDGETGTYHVLLLSTEAWGMM